MQKKLIFIYYGVVVLGLHQVLYTFLSKRIIHISQNNHFFDMRDVYFKI